MQILNYLTSGTVTVLLSGELDSLGNNGSRNAGVDYINHSGYPMAEVEFLGGQARSYANQSDISLWLLRCVVSGTYENGSSGFVPGRAPDVRFTLVSGITRATKHCRLPPGAMRPLVLNNTTGVALASSGNIVRILPHTYQAISG